MLKYTVYLLFYIFTNSFAYSLTDGEDVLYAVKSTSGSTQDWGTIAPSSGAFISITQISPTGLGWPLGDIGSEPDPINGYVFTTQTNSETSAVDILAIKKSDGSTKWLGLTSNDQIMGYDTKNNKLIIHRNSGSNNAMISFDMNDNSTETISSSFAASNNSWQVGARSAVNSFGREAYMLKSAGTSTIYKLNLDSGNEETISVSAQILAISWDSKNQKLYGLYDSDSNGAFRVVDVDTSDGSITNVGSANTVGGISNYVQLIAPNDQRYYVQESASDIRVISLTNGTSLGTFSAPLRLMPVGAVVVGSDSTNEEIALDINDPTSNLLKLGSNTVDYTGTSVSSGTTLILEGKLKVNGTANNSEAKVSSGASLGGAGTVGGIINNGNLEPGNSIGILNISGSVTLNSGSVLVIEVDSAGNTDKIVATGAVTAGGTLRISPGSGTYSSSQQYTIITGSSISGTFNTITVLSCSGTASASYGSTSIIITLSNCRSNASKNRETISSYVNDLSSGASGDLSTVITALNTLSGDNYSKALDALDYNTSGGILSVLQSQVASFNNVIGQRVTASTIGNNKVVSLVGFLKSSTTIDQSNTLSFEDKLKQMGMTGWWTQVHGGTGNKKSLKDIGVNGYDFNHFGTTIGLDQQTDKGIEGLALTFQQGTIDSDNSEGSTNHKTVAVSKYQSTNIEDGKRRTLSGSFGITNVDSSRTLNFASIYRTATASYNSFSLNGTTEYTYPEKQWLGSSHNLSLNGGLTFNYQEGFTETGANALNLKVDSNQTQLANAGLVDTIYWSDKTSGKTIPFLFLGIHTSYHLGSVESKQRFVNQTNFTTKSDRKSNTRGEIGLGFIKNKDNNTELSFLAKSKFSDKLSENTANFKYSVKF